MKLIVMLLAGLLSMPVIGSELGDARSAGYIVETSDGFVRAEVAAPANVKSLATEINKKRRQAYAKIAKKNGISIEQVGARSYAQRMKAK